MEKLVYLIGQHEGEAIAPFRDELLGPVAREILAGGARFLTVNVADVGDIPESIHVSNPDGLLSACLSVWLDSLDDRAPLEGVLEELGATLAGYLVTESIARDYADRDWADGTVSPGITLCAAFPKPVWQTDEAFYNEWQEGHTPMSLEVHPLTRYVRNAVARILTPGAPAFRAIVEERVGSLDDIANVDRFYGSEEGMERAIAHTARFTDPGSLQGMLMSEYILKS